jgi:hypothetical protein
MVRIGSGYDTLEGEQSRDFCGSQRHQQDQPMQAEPLPAIPIDYSHELDQTLLRLVRVLATLGLIIGSIGVISTPLSWLDPQWRTSIYSPVIRLISQLTSLMAIGLSVLLIIGSARCVRGMPRGRRLLLTYAYGYFAVFIIGVAVNTSFILQFYGGSNSYGRGYVLSLLGLTIARSLAGISFPLLLAVLLPRPEVRRIFDS